jgi:hypothetical protein
MSKPDWKTKPHERKRMTLQQENEQLKKRIEILTYERDDYIRSAKYFRDERDQVIQAKDRYAVLRTKDVMVLDGEPMYLKGEDLDKYCDEENRKFWGVSLSGMSSRGKGVTTQMMQAFIDEIQEKRNGNDTGSESKEADQKDSGHHTDVLRYADWYGLWKQRST